MAFDDLVLAMNSRPETVLVRREHVDAVCTCHQRHYQQSQAALLPSLKEHGRKFYEVNRKQLFAFMNDHMEVCGHV